MLFKLLDRLAISVLQKFGSWFVSEEDMSIEEPHEGVEGVNPNVVMLNNEEAMDRLDTKAGSLLTHISMMVAAASFMISAADTSLIEQIIIGIEIVAYLFFALLCLRCLAYRDMLSSHRTNNSGSSFSRYRRKLRREVLFRSRLLSISIRWVFLVTFIFMLSVLLHLIL